MLHYYIFTIMVGWKVFFHPFYISLTDIRYNPTNQNLEISQRIFWDDLEVALSDQVKSKVDFLNPEDAEKLNETVEKYLLSMMEISVNGKNAQLQYLGYEVEDDAAWFYFESYKVAVPKEVKVESRLLLDHFGSQQNIFNFYLGKKPKSLMLYEGNERGILKF
jgi:hypothetical protein